MLFGHAHCSGCGKKQGTRGMCEECYKAEQRLIDVIAEIIITKGRAELRLHDKRITLQRGLSLQVRHAAKQPRPDKVRIALDVVCSSCGSKATGIIASHGPDIALCGCCGRWLEKGRIVVGLGGYDARCDDCVEGA
jgi:NMD protein affecting ribosome stability and mRNA decay